jgi:hypothetical protein
MVLLALQVRPESADDYTKFPLPHAGGDELLVESIDESFAVLLGQNAKTALYADFVRRRALVREDIPERLDDFDECMQETFGRAAAVIERSILIRFYHKLGSRFPGGMDYTFSDFVNASEKGIRDLQF